ncbi:receptor-type tyrosine-protein phosphatase-like N isoform X2 [Takifugu flavidus]|uniref:receptor-type tyrosine-protein phosphatase-like N isoform X2 n=1 Tax=Takifugu flavidus TaxID=433684 RepID=UPI0025442DCD|nr:receptor-type tyrosine-protein phosphatase-like N isoform X2 [Takifugu flavidus]
MLSPRLWAALGRLLLLFTASCPLCETARHGCLFEKNLCRSDQLCSNDGLFGECQAAHQQPVQYQVSVQTLHKLQEVLKDLMVQGLTWRDDLTQDIIGRELSHIPTVSSSFKPHEKMTNRLEDSQHSHSSRPTQTCAGTNPNSHFRQLEPSQQRVRLVENIADPDVMQQYVDYMILDPSQSSVRMQTPLIDPYTYRQQFGFQDEEERSINSLDDLHAPSSRSRSGGNSRDRDKQLLQDLVSFYLSAPSSSSSSSSPVQTLSRNRGRTGFPSSSSSSSFFPNLDFPLDYGEDYISQMTQLRQQQQQQQQAEKNKMQEEYGTLSGLDDRSLQRLALLLDHLDLDAKDSSPEQENKPLATLKQLQLEGPYGYKQSKGLTASKHQTYGNKAATGEKISEGSTHKMAAAAVPPSSIKSLKSEEMQKDSNREEARKKEPEAKVEKFGYVITNQSVVGPAVTFRIRPNSKNLTSADVAEKAVAEKNILESKTGLKVLQSGVGEGGNGKALPLATRVQPPSRWAFTTLVLMACLGSVLVAGMTIACLRHYAHRLAAKKLGLGPEAGSFSHQEYQDLCRQHMASKGAFGRLEAAALGAVGGASGRGGGGAGVSGAAGGGASVGGGVDSRVSSVSSQFSDGAQPSPSSHSSTPSWCEEPAQANMDISTGHMILAYMEDHLRNKNRLMKEWEALCSYQAEPSAVSVAQSDANAKKNRCPDSVPYDHSRVKLKAEINPSRSDYINASTIIEHDPRMPAYIATQGPLSHTISDFWQMVWENGCTVIVMMTALVEDGEKQCDRYWPDEGSSLYHIYEVNLVSEHIWCNDFLVRSFYLKNVQTQETRTLTQFHFLSWPAQGIPTSTRPLLDFRRKVNKCYRGRSCPIIVHCSDGTGRTGTYILIDMVLNRMAKGVKEIDIAATLEHVRDQRPGMVRTKDQFEFALTAVAEEVNAILKALPQ